MSLNMYLGEVHTQTQSMNAICTATIQGMEQAIQSIDAFAINTALQGQTYSSAKAFFTETFRPLAQGIIYLCEELIRQNDAFPSQFESKVASTDVIEQEILEQIQEIDRMKTSMEAVSQAMPIPSMDAMANLFTLMRKKLQEKLDHLYEFNQTSSNNYATALQLAASIATGLAEVQSGKGFSPASGTFSTQGLNMEWTTSIQEIIAKREAERFSSQGVEELGQSDFMKNDKTISDQLDEGVRVGSGRAVRDGIEDFKALGDKETWEDMGYAASHPFNTLRAMYNVLSDSYIKNVKNGDFEDAVIWFSYSLTGIGVGLIGDKGIGKITKVLKGARYAKVKDIKVPRIQQTVTNWVDNLSIENRLAFADTNGLNLRSSFDSSTFNKAEDTMVYAKTTGGKTRVKDVQEVIQDYADKVLDRVKVEGEHLNSYTASKVLREELKEVGIEPPPYPNAAHHIAPWNDRRAAQVQELLEEFGIHHNSAANGVFLPGYGAEGHKYVTTEALHIGNHSPEYIREVYRVLSEVKRFEGNQADAVAALQKIRERLLDGSLKLNEPK
ncbi:cytoplasmic protein [Bacillus pseudomycoides]|uniref:AHH domain-containing protein n=1 Tax=Bacillus pseudomycoides TaxID=64104 RepID=UPI000BFE23C6|nr:AHH domain-containing protein [Bacillus pseudomycoides]PHB21070.1 cytoplasmic protein [Bacillus pseudomycoides]